MNNHDLDRFKCVLSYEFSHFVTKGAVLPCGHSACLECIKSFKENTGEKEINCQTCNKPNRLDIDYCESFLSNEFLELKSENLIDETKHQFEESYKNFKSIHYSLIIISK